jgi:phosphonate transport system permease protein
VSWPALRDGFGEGAKVVGFFFPPDWSTLGEMIGPAGTTVLLAAVATPLGVLLSLVFGLAGAKNIAPAWLRTPARVVIGVERALPEIILLLLLVAALGIGPFPGVIALAIGSIGMLGKLLADAIEEIDARVLESVESVGATRWQVIRHAVLPEVMPALLSNSIFRFEVNIRASVLLGAVGAGGIGYELNKAMGMLEYERVSVAILVTLALVFGAERVSDQLRRPPRAGRSGGLRCRCGRDPEVQPAAALHGFSLPRPARRRDAAAESLPSVDQDIPLQNRRGDGGDGPAGHPHRWSGGARPVLSGGGQHHTPSRGAIRGAGVVRL